MTPKEKRKKDREFSQLILGRDKRICHWCGKSSGKMDTSHIIPRECLALRWAPENAICLCFQCHKRKWHHNPLAAIRWLDSKYGAEKCNALLSASMGVNH